MEGKDPVAVHQFSSRLGNRPVWVVNNYSEPWVENFRGKEITIPPNGEKVVTMPYLAARRFLGQGAPLAEQMPDGSYRTQPKMLKTIELSKAELKNKGISREDMLKAQKKDEERAQLKCGVCGMQATSAKGLKIHTTKAHPEAVVAEEEDAW